MKRNNWISIIVLGIVAVLVLVVFKDFFPYSLAIGGMMGIGYLRTTRIENTWEDAHDSQSKIERNTKN